MKFQLIDFKYLKFLIYNIFSLLFLFLVSRWLFYFFNKNLFIANDKEVFIAILYGLRFDLSSIIYLNIPFIIFYLLPFSFRESRIVFLISKIYFFTINSIGLLANFSDIIYYRFTLKRTTSDIFSFISVGGDFEKLLPQFVKDFWFVFFIWLISIFFLYFVLKKSKFKKNNNNEFNLVYFVKHTIIFVSSLVLLLIGMRGGLQLRPININTAGLYGNSNLTSIVLNTPFTIIHSIGKSELITLNYFSEKELESIYSPQKILYINNLIPDSISRKQNIVLIIVESLSTEHIGALNHKVPNFVSYTPFLDTIIEHSISFRATSNGKKSIEGVPAILSGIPTLMNTPFISSAYGGNKYESIATILKSKGYKTKFFHGGANGTMGFDAYSKIAGFESYYGKNEYNNNNDYDGMWGIWDEPFLKYSAEMLNDTKQPFFAAIFTLSSHHPYSIPDKYKNIFNKSNNKIQNTISYTDFSLKQFFLHAKNHSWFDNTLFIITADHTSETISNDYSTNFGNYQIPIIIYSPNSNLKPFSRNIVAQQIDIMPTILSYLQINDTIINFGNNLLDTNNIFFAINYQQPIYQFTIGKYFMQFDGKKLINVFDIENDIEMKNNILINDNFQKELRFLQAFLQQYNNRLIFNKLTVR